MTRRRKEKREREGERKRRCVKSTTADGVEED